MQFFLLAGGLGKRALPLTLLKPKPVFPLHGIPLLSLMFEQLLEKRVTTGLINVHHLPQLVEDCIPSTMTIKVIHEDQLSGNKVLKAALPEMDEMILKINGDIFVDIPIQHMTDKMAECDCDAVLLTRRSNRRDCPALDISGDRFLTRRPWRNKTDHMYTGIALLRRQVIECIDELNLFDSLAKNNFDVRILPHEGIWLEIGAPAHYFQANKTYREYFKIRSSNSLSKGVEISEGSVVTDSVVWDNTKIMGQSTLKSCIVMNDLILQDVHYQWKIISANQIWDFTLP